MKALQGYDGTPEAMRRLLVALIVDPSKITDGLIERRQASATRPGAMEAMSAFVKATGALRSDPVLSLQMNMRTTLPALTAKIPTIFIWGEEDSFALPASGRELEALLPEVTFHWVPGASHQVQTDKPEEVVEIIKAFLRD